MTEDDKGGANMAVLHRMISYIREEALRLRVMDVAVLLEQAQEAVSAFAPAPAGQAGHAPGACGAGRVEH